MPTDAWTLERAKNAFSAVVAAAERGEPQLVTKRGKPAVYVLSVSEYQRLHREEQAPEQNFIEFLRSAPKRPPSIPDDEELFPREAFVERPPFEFGD